LGNEPTTSARPPVLIKGTHSDAVNKIFFIVKPPDRLIIITIARKGDKYKWILGHDYGRIFEEQGFAW